MVDLISLSIKNISTLLTIRREVDIEKCLIKAPRAKKQYFNPRIFKDGDEP
jgi:hypothetical protein